jgi:parallel beta-helix repeat protein
MSLEISPFTVIDNTTDVAYIGPMRWLILFLLLSLLASAEGKTWVVDATGSGDSTTISGAVMLAEAGDEIVIKPGDYTGASIDRPLSISGVGDAKVRGLEGEALRVLAPGCRISNLSLEGQAGGAVLLASSDNILSRCSIAGGSAGILVEGNNNTVALCQVDSPLGLALTASGCSVSNVTFVGRPDRIDTGIQIKRGEGNSIVDSAIYTATGIEISSSKESRVENSTFSGSRFGLVLTAAEECKILHNLISGGYVSGLDAADSTGNNLSGNNITGCKLGISLRGSADNLLSGNLCQGNERAGIYLMNSSKNQIRGNRLLRNGNGILLAGSQGNMLAANYASQNNTYGISLRGSAGNTLRKNNMSSNLYNLRVDGGEGSNESQDADLSSYSQDIDSSNTADGKLVCYMVGKAHLEINQSYGFVGVISCLGATVSNQSISNSSTGLLVVNSTGIRVHNSSISQSETGVCLRDCRSWSLQGCQAERCQIGFSALRSSGGLFQGCSALSCGQHGFQAEKGVNLTWKGCSAQGGRVGLYLRASQLCRVLESSFDQNKEDGVRLIASHSSALLNNTASSNQRGITLSSSNGCRLAANNASGNSMDGFHLEQLSGGEIRGCQAAKNGQGIFLQSCKAVSIENNSLTENDKYGLRMSMSQMCNVTDNLFAENHLSGANLVDCRGNILYHNVFAGNGFQNAQDNGYDQWDGGPEVGGNYWNDFKVVGNPSASPRQIPSKGVDRYPFQSQYAWRQLGRD